MDRFDCMRAFTRVVELHSFTKAAQSLSLPKATLSAQVAALEKQLSVKLLHRTTRHVSVTTSGEAYYHRVIQLLRDLEETESAVSQSRVSHKGRLRIDSSATLTREVLLPSVNNFFTRYPEIELEIGSTDRTVDLLEENVDCAIRGGMPIDESLVARKLLNTHRITCASPTYLAQNGTPLTPEDIKRHAVVNFQSPRTNKINPFMYEIEGKMTEINGRRRLATNDTGACVAAALSDIGLIQLPYLAVRSHIESGRLVQVLSNTPSEVITLYIVYLQNRHLSANVRAFVDWAVELFKQEQKWYDANCLQSIHQ